MIFIHLSEDLKGFSITTKGYEVAIVEKIRRIPGRVWHANNLEWTVPIQEQTMQLLHKLFGPEHVHFEDSLRKIEIVRKWFPSDVTTAKAIRVIRQFNDFKGLQSKDQKGL